MTVGAAAPLKEMATPAPTITGPAVEPAPDQPPLSPQEDHGPLCGSGI